jgi:hypothetical protein
MAERIISENGMYAETYRGDRPEPHNSCILQAWSAGLYAWAFSEIVVGINVDMVQNKVRFDPHLPEALLKDTAMSLHVERGIRNSKGRAKISAMIDFGGRRISVAVRGNAMPEIISESFDIRLLN